MAPGVRWASSALVALILPWFDTASASPPARAAYVVGAGDASIARVDLDTNQVTPALAIVGTLANRIEVSEDLSYAVVVNSGSHDVTIFDLATESVTGTIGLPVDSSPWTAEVVGDRVFATALRADLLYELDRVSLGVVDSVATGQSPEGLCLADGKLWVANTGFDFDTFQFGLGTVSVFDVDDLSPVATIPVGTNPQECLIAPDGTVHVICTGDFAGVTGTVHVLDPAGGVPVDTLAVASYPGGGAVHESGAAVLNVLTPSFGSEIWVYDTAALSWIHDGADPLLPSFDFYGNLRLDAAGRILVPDFDADLLIIEDPADPGSPDALLVGDGPIDLAVVEREDPVPVILSGLSAAAADDGLRLSWHATIEADVFGFVVERRTPADSGFERVASGLPARRTTVWTDHDTQFSVPYTYRVGTVGAAGGVTWAASITFVRRPLSDGRLAIHRTFPNPSRAEVTIEAVLPRAAPASLEIVDVGGRRVAEVETGPLPAGPARIVWDGRGVDGARVTPGMYWARLRVGPESAIARVLRTR